MRQIGFVFIEGFADWEFGHLAGAVAEWFGSPPAAARWPARARGGENEDLDVVALIGS